MIFGLPVQVIAAIDRESQLCIDCARNPGNYLQTPGKKVQGTGIEGLRDLGLPHWDTHFWRENSVFPPVFPVFSVGLVRLWSKSSALFTAKSCDSNHIIYIVTRCILFSEKKIGGDLSPE